jgi:hypothetical protein
MTGNAIPDLLATHLQAEVPLRILELRPVPENERRQLANQASEELAAHGDVIAHSGTRDGDTAAAVSWLVTGLACAAYAPGGVKFGRLGWCAAHPAHRWARHDRVCGACLTARATAEPDRPRPDDPGPGRG